MSPSSHLGHQKQVGPAQSSATLPAGATPDVTDTGVVLYKGTVLNIVHTMEQHRKVDDERATALLKVEELSHQLSKDHFFISRECLNF